MKRFEVDVVFTLKGRFIVDTETEEDAILQGSLSNLSPYKGVYFPPSAKLIRFENGSKVDVKTKEIQLKSEQ